METEINQYLAVQRGLAEEQRQERRDRPRDRDRRDRDRDRDRGRRSRFSERDDRDKERDYNNRDRDRDSSTRDRISDRDDNGYGRNDSRGDRRSQRSVGSGGSAGRGSSSSSDRPSRTIMLKNCHNSIDDSDIRTVLQLFGAPIKDVRLVKHRDTGVSRGFAFVEFQFLPDAQRWMEENQGRVEIAGHPAQMVYSANREREEDWFCSQCGTHNFKRREYCFKCSIPKEESERFSEISSIPTTTLLLMGLDALTTEDTVSRSLNDISAVDMNIRIARDHLTNTSRGLCYVDLASLELSSHLLDILCNKMSPPFSIDGKHVSVHYCKAPQQLPVSLPPGCATGANAIPVALPTSTNVASTAIAAAQWTATADKQANLAAAQEAALQPQQQHLQQQQQQQPQFDASYYTEQYGAAQQQVIAQQQYNIQNYASRYQDSVSGSVDDAAEVSSSSKSKTKSNSGKKSAADSSKLLDTSKYPTVTVDGQEYPVYPPPEVSKYQYDDSTGYYFDPTTGLYYDATSKYYFNSVTQAYMYWDSNKSTYLPAPSNGQGDSELPSSEPQDNDVDGSPDYNADDDKKEGTKNKMAKKVAKDMARWAKSLNSAKMSASKRAQAAAVAAANRNAQPGAADAGFSMLMKKADPKETKSTVMDVLKRKSDIDNPIVAQYGGGSDSDEGDQDQISNGSGSGGNIDESSLTDWNKLICLLCKRQFPSHEVLVKHQQFSDLHKQNLEALQSRALSSQSEQDIKYRDRAKERRDKYGVPEPPQPKKRRGKNHQQLPAAVPFEEPTKHGLGEDNIGNKMLKAMGWNERGGLGKKHQGRRAPIEVTRRREGAGLGSKGSGFVADGDTYKDNVKKMTQYRYQELF